MTVLDDNNKYVAMAVDTNGNPAPLKVDSSGYLLIEITSCNPTHISTLHTKAEIDENHTHTKLAYNGADDVPLLIDSDNGFLLVDIA